MSKKTAAPARSARPTTRPARPANRLSSDQAVNRAADRADKNVRGAEAGAIAGTERATDPANAVADVDTSAIQPPSPHHPPAMPGNTLAEARKGDAARTRALAEAPTDTSAIPRIPSRNAEIAAARRLPRARPAAAAAGEEGPARDLGQLIRVRATRMGFIDNIRRREGDVFDCHEAEFSEKWMEVVDGDTPEKLTSGKQELQRKHDELLRDKVKRGGDPLGADSATARA